MCDTSSSKHSVSRRSVLGAALAGTAGAVASSVGFAPKAAAAPPVTKSPLTPALPVGPSQPYGPVITQLGTAGGPQAEYVRTGTSTVLTVRGFNYVIDTGRSSVTQYLNSGLLFSKLSGIFITHLHADHLADYFNYFLLEGGQPNAEGDMLLNPPPGPALPVPTFGPGSAGALPPQPPPPQKNVPVISPDDPTPGLRTLTDRMIEAYAYSFNVFMRGDGYASIYDWTSAVKDIVIPPNVKASAANPAPVGMKPFQIYSDAQVTVTAILVPHGEVFPCFAYRFDTVDGQSVVFSGDTSKSDNVVALAQNADVLVHCAMEWDVIVANAILKGKDPTTDPLLVHLHRSLATTKEVGQVAQAAGVPQLILTHLIPSNPRDVPDEVWTLSVRAGGYRGNIHVGNDFDQIPVVGRTRTPPPAPTRKAPRKS